MKYFYRVIVVLFLLLAFPTLPAFAHYEESDGSMTVTLHIDPNDNPIPGKESNLYFLFDDSTKKFQLENCQCTVSISENNKKIFQGQLSQQAYTKPNLFDTNIPFIFPERNTYEIVLRGKPIQPNSFIPFTISWEYNVDPDDFPGIVPERPNDIPTILLAVIGICTFFLLFGWFLKKQVMDSDNIPPQKKKSRAHLKT